MADPAESIRYLNMWRQDSAGQRGTAAMFNGAYVDDELSSNALIKEDGGDEWKRREQC